MKISYSGNYSPSACLAFSLVLVHNASMTQNSQWDSARRQIGQGKVSVIMPAFNLGATIAENVREVRDLLGGQVSFEIIAVDDGSTDNTRAELEVLSLQIPELRPVYQARNKGKGEALRAGFATSRGNYILLLDADLDLPPAQISGLFDVMEKRSVDAVIGSKLHPQSDIGLYPWHRRFMSFVYYMMVKVLVGLPVRDTQTGIKLFRREALEWAFPRILAKQFAFDLELLSVAHQKGFTIAESPVALKSGAKWGWHRPKAVRQVLKDTLAIFYRLRLLRYYQSIRDTRMPDPPPLVSIVVAYPKHSPYLDECLEGIRKQTYTHYEVILLPDEASGNVYPDPIREEPTGSVRPAEKRNMGITQAKGGIVAFVDDDVVPLEDWLENAVVYFSNPEVAAVGGPASTAPNDSFMAKLGGRVYASPLVSGSYRYRYEPERVREIDDYPSCNLLVRTEVLRQLKGFRTDFWPGEDTYLCLEIVRNLKKTMIYDPRVHVYHHRRRLFLPHLRQIGRYALHRGFFAKTFPATSLRLAYMIPSLFVLGIVCGGAACAFLPPLLPVYLGVLALYGALTFLAAFHRNPLGWLLSWLGIVMTHLVYGIRFLIGLLVRRLPGEVRKFDHASEKGEMVNG